MKRHRFLVFLLMVFLSSGGCGTGESQEEIQAGENQELLYGAVTGMAGNQITYTQVEPEERSGQEGQRSQTRQEKAQDKQEMPNIPQKQDEQGMLDIQNSQEASDSASVTTLIPVGVLVHTTTGTCTTFSRIAIGDVLKLLVETDENGDKVIVEIWMT